MPFAHALGFPRFGLRRELERALQEATGGAVPARAALAEAGRESRHRHWRQQADAGLDMVPAGDFSWHDGVLDHSLMFGVIPERFRDGADETDIDTYFRMARGRAPTGTDAHACEMTKWFDTNYHYIVPELRGGPAASAWHAGRCWTRWTRRRRPGIAVKPVLLGPVTCLALAKSRRRRARQAGAARPAAAGLPSSCCSGWPRRGVELGAARRAHPGHGSGRRLAARP
ncbi:MAG: hypothetical protein U5L11_16675 [Arhodomonas sp.]|nr:hypothetical protein [Arhodomonas sp.]